MIRRVALVLVTLAACAAARAQTPAPVVIQAMTPGQSTVPRAATAQAPATTADSGALLKTLLEIKAANEATLQKQAATLQQLDDIEKAADQIKVYSKRG